MIKRITGLINSSSETLPRRMFLLSCIVGSIAMFAVFMVSLLSGQGIVISAGLAVGLIILIIVTIFALKTDKLTLAGSIMVLISCCVVCPVGYILGGGAYSGAPVWFILGFMFVFILFKGALFWIYLVLTIAAFAAATWVGARYPDLVVPLPTDYGIYLDTFIATTVVGMVAGILIKFQNIVLEREIDRVEAQRDEIEKLNESQSNFFSSMSHEIRTPINTIIGLNEMTLREKKLPEEVAENTVNIQNASRLLLSLINDLLDMSKIQSGNMEITPGEYDTSDMLSEITNLHWNKAMEKGLHFDIQVGENIPPMLYGDETRIKQVIINLLTNAIKYTEEGYVTLRIGGETSGPDTFMLSVEVEDSGMGIKKENMDSLFDAFRRVEGEESKNIEGTGLGLSITKQLVELMNGTINVNSIYTKGSTFRVEIPQGIAKEGNISFAERGIKRAVIEDYHQSFEAPEAKVLIVDDNDLNRMVCQKLLRSTRVQADTAESGKDCLEMTKEKHYDAILMDHEMPQMDGIETLRKLRRQSDGLCKDTPVIALTANAGSDREAFYIDQGFSAYLAKPIQSRQLENILLASLPKDLIERDYTDRGEEIFHTYEAVHKIPFMITTDSICDLPEDMLRENEIRIMPYYIVTKYGRFRDLDEIDADNLQQLISKGEQEIHSDPAPIAEYEEFFGDALSEARMVLHLSSCKKVSSAYDRALSASRSFGNVYVMDSGQMSTGMGMMAVKAAELFRSGMRVEEVINELEGYSKRIKLNFLVPYLLKSGTKYNMPLLPRLLMNVFNMEPVFSTKNSGLVIRRFMLGYIRNTQDQFVRYCLAHKNNINTKRVYVTFSCCTPEQRQHILDEIQKLVDFEEIVVHKASAATYSNCGSNSVGIIYETEEEF